MFPSDFVSGKEEEFMRKEGRKGRRSLERGGRGADFFAAGTALFIPNSKLRMKGRHGVLEPRICKGGTTYRE